MKYVPLSLIDNIAALVHIMAWYWTGDKPLSEEMAVWFTDVIYTPLGLKELTDIEALSIQGRGEECQVWYFVKTNEKQPG